MYEDKAVNDLTSVFRLDIGHAISEEVHRLYKLPSDFGTARELYVNHILYEFFDEDYRQVPPFGYYTVKFLENVDQSLQASFIVMPQDIGDNKDCTFYYFKKANIIATDADKVDAPDGHGLLWIIKKMEEYCWDVQGEIDLANTARVKADAEMESYLLEIAHRIAEGNRDPMFDYDDFGI